MNTSLIDSLRSLYFRHRVRSVLKNKDLNNRQQCLELLNLITGDRLAKQKPNKYASIRLSLAMPDIVSYTKLLKDINYHLSNSITISSDLVLKPHKVVSLDTFFTDGSDYYVDINRSFEKFKQECSRMLILMQPSDEAEYGYYEYAGRTFKNLLVNIQELLNKLAVGLLNQQ